MLNYSFSNEISFVYYRYLENCRCLKEKISKVSAIFQKKQKNKIKKIIILPILPSLDEHERLEVVENNEQSAHEQRGLPEVAAEVDAQQAHALQKPLDNSLCACIGHWSKAIANHKTYHGRNQYVIGHVFAILHGNHLCVVPQFLRHVNTRTPASEHHHVHEFTLKRMKNKLILSWFILLLKEFIIPLATVCQWNTATRLLTESLQVSHRRCSKTANCGWACGQTRTTESQLATLSL